MNRTHFVATAMVEVVGVGVAAEMIIEAGIPKIVRPVATMASIN
jgi:hypothetical protein